MIKNKINLCQEQASKWLNCNPSIILEEKVRKVIGQADGFSNSEEVMAKNIVINKLKINFKSDNLHELDQQSNINKQASGYSETMDKKLDIIIHKVRETVREIETKGEKPLVVFNEEMDNSLWINEGKVTVPIAIISSKSLEIIAYNYKEKPKDIKDKFSIMELYALAVINEYICLYEMEYILLRYIQVSDGVETIKYISTEDMLRKAEYYIKPASENAIEGNGELKVGNYCNSCSANFLCNAQNEDNIKLLDLDARETFLLTDEEILIVLQNRDRFKKWIDEVCDYAVEECKTFNKTWEGFKLVEARTTRKYVDEDIVKDTLVSAGFEEDKLCKKSLLSLSALEKVVGKDRLTQLLGDLIVKPTGKQILAPLDDKRPEIKII